MRREAERLEKQRKGKSKGKKAEKPEEPVKKEKNKLLNNKFGTLASTMSDSESESEDNKQNSEEEEEEEEKPKKKSTTKKIKIKNVEKELDTSDDEDLNENSDIETPSKRRRESKSSSSSSKRQKKLTNLVYLSNQLTDIIGIRSIVPEDLYERLDNYLERNNLRVNKNEILLNDELKRIGSECGILGSDDKKKISQYKWKQIIKNNMFNSRNVDADGIPLPVYIYHIILLLFI